MSNHYHETNHHRSSLDLIPTDSEISRIETKIDKIETKIDKILWGLVGITGAVITATAVQVFAHFVN